MVAIMDALEEDKFIAGGQSMGCATSIYVGLAASERVKGLLLMNPPTAWETRAAQSDLYNRMAKIGRFLGGGMLGRLMGCNPERLLPAWLLEADALDITGIVEGLKALKRKTLSNLMRGAALMNLPPRESLIVLNMPTSILAWEGDVSHPLETAEELNRLLPQSELMIARNFADFKKWPSLIRDFVQKV